MQSTSKINLKTRAGNQLSILIGRITAFYFFLSILGCTKSVILHLDSAISNSRRQAINVKNREYLKVESKYRKRFLETLSSNYNLNFQDRIDTLIIVEYTDNICANCTFDKISLLANDIVFKSQNCFSKKRDCEITTDTLRHSTHSQLIGDGMWRLKTYKNQNNVFEPELYESNCLGGSRANITWILPNKSCRSIHVNCIW